MQTKILTIRGQRKIDAGIGVHLMITIRLGISINKILRHYQLPRSLFDCASTEPAKVLVVALYLSLSKTWLAFASISAPVCLPVDA
jgi:hypothetical protein